MFNIQNTLIAIAVSFMLGASVGSVSAWKYQSNKYEKQIAQTDLKQQQELSKANSEVVKKNTEKEDVTAEANKREIEQSKQIDKLAADNRKYLNERGRLLIKSSSNPATASTSDSASSTPADETTTTELPEGFSAYLLNTLKSCDEAAHYAEVAHEYATEIEKQRNEMATPVAPNTEKENK